MVHDVFLICQNCKGTGEVKNDEEVAKILADADWWAKVAEMMDCDLVGFSFRNTATFKTAYGATFQFPGVPAHALMEKYG